jgi:YfiH family protein
MDFERSRKINRMSKNSEGVYLVSDIEGITVGVVGKSANTIDYSQVDECIRSDEKALLREITGISEKRIILLNQVHQDNIIIIDRAPERNELFFASADAMITDIPEICLVIRTADCVPVYAFDVQRRVLGVAHSGWKGCRLSIARKLVSEMCDGFGSKKGDFVIFILPSIGPDSYIVDRAVASLFEDNIVEMNDKIYLNLWDNIESSLIDYGIPKENIHNTGLCTLKNCGDFFSFRNRDVGRNLNFGFISAH